MCVCVHVCLCVCVCVRACVRACVSQSCPWVSPPPLTCAARFPCAQVPPPSARRPRPAARGGRHRHAGLLQEQRPGGLDPGRGHHHQELWVRGPGAPPGRGGNSCMAAMGGRPFLLLLLIVDEINCTRGQTWSHGPAVAGPAVAGPAVAGPWVGGRSSESLVSPAPPLRSPLLLTQVRGQRRGAVLCQVCAFTS